MRVAPGSRLGPYEILSPIGAGGMGEVWKARDSRLDRIVALKVSNAQFPERFEREARAVAAMNHPHICQLYDVGPDYLVMEFVEGAPLAGPLTLAQAVEYAEQILEALDAAHCKGITHRDLKPANILVTKQGIKLLDFGLAKQSGPALASDETVTSALTSKGQIVGTLQYMSPEQLQGKETDARSDLFAFGCVLYEMLTGKRAFGAESAASTIAAILEREAPSVTDIAPGAFNEVMRRCLAKDPDERWQTARDVRHALALAMGVSPAAVGKQSQWKWAAAIALVALGAGVLGWIGALLWQPVAEERTFHLQMNPPPGAGFVTGANGGIEISPDGRTVAFVAASGNGLRLWFRRLDSLAASELPGTEGAQYPFWSPDSRSIGFFSGGKLKRIELAGGPPVVIADAPTARGGTWNSAGTIVFASFSGLGGLKQVSETGGTPVLLPVVNVGSQDVVTVRWPHFLPDGKRLLYSLSSNRRELAGVYLASLDRPGVRIPLPEGAGAGEGLSAAAYAPPRGRHPGYLLWVRANTLMAQPFDPTRMLLSGKALPVPGAGVVGTLGYANYPSFSVSHNGTIANDSESNQYQPAWFDRSGAILSSLGQPERYAALRIAPDGQRAALMRVDSSGNRDIWLMDLTRGVQTRLTVDGRGFVAVWSPDGRRLAYHLANTPYLFVRDASGAGPEETVLKANYPVYINDWSPDSRYLIYTQLSPEGQGDLWLLPLGGGEPLPYLKTAANETHGQFSPDGKWIAYSSDESGRPEVYVQGMPAGTFRVQVSNSGGSFPRWRSDGKELFYRALDGKLMVAPARSATQGLEFGTPAALFRIVEPLGAYAYPYDVSADGQRILALAPPGGLNFAAPLTLLVNWDAGWKE
jgi:Tol biopolymer transport system component/predicted Ser/Thr protein kinase